MTNALSILLRFAAYAAIIGLFLSSAAPAFSSTASTDLPNLVPWPAVVAKGIIEFRNIGAAPAGPSHVYISCRKTGSTSGGRCAGWFATPFPAGSVVSGDGVTIPVTGLAAGNAWMIGLDPVGGWRSWPPGTYIFTIRVDSRNEVKEANEADNMGTGILTLPQ